MSYRVMVHGVPIECASQADAISLAKAVAQEGAASERKARRGNAVRRENDTPIPPSVTPPAATSNGQTHTGTRQGWGPPAALSKLFLRLNEQQKGALRLIATTDDEVPLDVIRSSLNLKDRRQASILLAACSRVAKDCGFQWAQIAEFHITGKGAERQSFYKPGPLLRGEGAGTG